jgi:hypothetical protein
MESVVAPCSSCVRKTSHRILHTVTQREGEGDRDVTYVMMECAGCKTISMGRHTRHLQYGELEHSFYPSPVSRKKPTWLWKLNLRIGATNGPKTGSSLFHNEANDEGDLTDLLEEIYQAVDGGQHWLAAMGIRALFEQVMIMKVGDLKTFQEKLDTATLGCDTRAFKHYYGVFMM